MCRFEGLKKQIERHYIKEKNRQKREGRNKEITEFIIANSKKTCPKIAAQMDPVDPDSSVREAEGQ